MISTFKETNTIDLPFINQEISMVPFDLETLKGLPVEFKETVEAMLKGVKAQGTAFFTIHGKALKAGGTLRRPAPHTDGNYEPVTMGFGDEEQVAIFAPYTTRYQAKKLARKWAK